MLLKNLFNRKIIVFGASNGLLENLNKVKLSVKYVVDNDSQKWTKTIAGLEIKNPLVLTEEKDITIIVLSSYFDEIAIQLINMGFVENHNFYDGMLLLPLLENTEYELEKYINYSFPKNSERLTEEQLESRIIAVYHGIEKGLAMRKVRENFGEEKIQFLLTLLGSYKQKGYSLEKDVFKAAISSVHAYIDYHKRNNYCVNKIEVEFKKIVNNNQRKQLINTSFAGVKKITKEEIQASATSDFQDLIQSRFSIRHFAKKSVDIKDIKEAVMIAQKSPSVCNRQTNKVYVIDNKELKEHIFGLQKGNKGFGDEADKLLVITSKLQAFIGSREKNQCFIDGGIFGMSLIYALHYKGLGVCTLNWCVDKGKDIELRKKINIPESESIIFFLAVGHLPKELNVAKSKRKPIGEVLEII